MKTLILLLIAASLTGCANPQFAKNFGDGFAAQSQARAQSSQATYQQYMQNNQAKQTDNQCFQACTQAGYQYGLCKSKCTY